MKEKYQDVTNTPEPTKEYMRGFHEGRLSGIKEGLAMAMESLRRLDESRPGLLPPSPCADISMLGLETRIENTLRRYGFSQIQALFDVSGEELLCLRGFGIGFIRRIQVSLEVRGYSLKK